MSVRFLLKPTVQHEGKQCFLSGATTAGSTSASSGSAGEGSSTAAGATSGVGQSPTSAGLSTVVGGDLVLKTGANFVTILLLLIIVLL